MKCANCGNRLDEKGFFACDDCWKIPISDGSEENKRGWWAWYNLINGKWSMDEMRQFADSPEIQKFLKQLIAAMEYRSLFILKEAKKVIE